MITDDMKNLVEGTMLCFAATINEDGSPNLSPKVLWGHDDAHLLFANMASPGTADNLRDPGLS